MAVVTKWIRASDANEELLSKWLSVLVNYASTEKRRKSEIFETRKWNRISSIDGTKQLTKQKEFLNFTVAAAAVWRSDAIRKLFWNFICVVLLVVVSYFNVDEKSIDLKFLRLASVAMRFMERTASSRHTPNEPNKLKNKWTIFKNGKSPLDVFHLFLFYQRFNSLLPFLVLVISTATHTDFRVPRFQQIFNVFRIVQRSLVLSHTNGKWKWKGKSKWIVCMQFHSVWAVRMCVCVCTNCAFTLSIRLFCHQKENERTTTSAMTKQTTMENLFSRVRTENESKSNSWPN